MEQYRPTVRCWMRPFPSATFENAPMRIIDLKFTHEVKLHGGSNLHSDTIRTLPLGNVTPMRRAMLLTWFCEKVFITK